MERVADASREQWLQFPSSFHGEDGEDGVGLLVSLVPI